MGRQGGICGDGGGSGWGVAAELAVGDHGARALGRAIEVLSADRQNKPDIASAIVRQWFDVDGVDMVTDVPLTSVALAVQNVARDKRKVVVITGAASADLTGKACSPYSAHWMDDTTALSVGTARAVVAA